MGTRAPRSLSTPAIGLFTTMCMCVKLCRLSFFVKVFLDAEVVFMPSREAALMRAAFSGVEVAA